MIAIISVLVFFISKKSIYDELEYLIIVIAVILFIFLSRGLYVAARIRGKPTTPRFTFLKKMFKISFDSFDLLDSFGDIEFLAWIPATIFVVVFLVFFTTTLWSAIIGLIFVFTWVVHRAVRLVLVKGYLCRRNFVKSISFAFLYTILYSGWIFGIVWIVEHKPWQYFKQ